MAGKGFGEWSFTALRIALAAVFMYHGYGKLFAPGGFTGTVTFFTSIGIPLPNYAALLVGIVEFFGGLFLFLGMVTKWSSTLLLIDMLVALFKVHLKNGMNSSKGGYEFVLILIAGLIVIWANGPGKLAFGKFFKGKRMH